MEIWKTLVHPMIQDGYMLSSHGRIKNSIDDNIKPYEASYHSSNGYDYEKFVLKEEYKTKSNVKLFMIDTLIASTFIPMSDELKGKRVKVNHIDGCNRNNHIDNLEWVEDVEEWKTIVDHRVCEDMYEVSNKGRVRKKLSKEYCMLHRKYNGYIVVHLRRPEPSAYDHHFCTHSVHRLVADAFVTKSKYNVVNHIDGSPSNNDSTNLEYVSINQNTRHAVLTGLKKSIPTEDLDMVRVLLNKYKYTRIVYNKIDHDKYPYLTSNVIAHIKAGRYDRTNINSIHVFHPGKMTTDEIDMVRDKLIENDGNCKIAYGLIDHSMYPHITLQMVKEIKTNKYSSYARSNKYDLNNLKFKRTLPPCRITDVEIDMVRDLLMINNGSVNKTTEQINHHNQSISIDMVSDIKRGKSYRRSNKYDLEKSSRYPFILKEND